MKTQTILITGATAGLGRGLAIALAKRGHHVIATGRRQELLDSLVSEASGKVDVFTLDVTKKESIESARAQVATLTGGKGIDVLVNNAGFGILAPFEMTTDDEMRGMFETNVFGLASMTRAFLPEMRARGRGKIVNVSSVGGRITLPFFGAYNATKYAVESISDAMRVELKSFGVDVVLIEPGATNTEFNTVAFASDALGDGEPKATPSPYASALVKLADMRATIEKTAASADSVVRGMVSAVEASSPRARYVLPSYNLLGIFFKSILPTGIWDFLLGAISGLRSLPKAKSDSSTPALAS